MVLKEIFIRRVIFDFIGLFLILQEIDDFVNVIVDEDVYEKLVDRLLCFLVYGE